MPIEQRVANSNIDTRFTWAEFIQPFRNLRIKYTTLNTMDHFSKMEEQKKESEKKDKTSVWKGEKDEVRKIKKEFETISAVKSHRKQMNLD